MHRCIAPPKPAILKMDVVIIVFFEIVYEPCLSLSNGALILKIFPRSV